MRIALAAWTVIAIALAFAASGASADTATRLIILGYLAAGLVLARRASVEHPRRGFFALSALGAFVCEASYMISRPLDPSLLVTDETTFGEGMRALAIDLVLVAPAYAAILAVAWWLARRYAYSVASYWLVVGGGQALGDGMGFFFANPVGLLFAPYVMTNYWAMTGLPYLVVHAGLGPRRPPGVVGHLLPLALMPVTYFAAATVIFTVGRALGLVP